jgi:RNA polymerase sigma-70 factor (ECF subfamily)
MLQLSDDSELAGRAVGGDREAFRLLLERHYDMVYRLAYRALGSKADAEDVAQDVCVTLVNKLDRFERRSRFTTWLASIVINQCRDFVRRRKSAAGLVEKYGVLRALDGADHADSERRSEWLHEALGKLEPTLRETALLVVGEEMSHAEAAQALGCAESTISWRMHELRKRLRAELDNDDG